MTHTPPDMQAATPTAIAVAHIVLAEYNRLVQRDATAVAVADGDPCDIVWEVIELANGLGYHVDLADDAPENLWSQLRTATVVYQRRLCAELGGCPSRADGHRCQQPAHLDGVHSADFGDADGFVTWTDDTADPDLSRSAQLPRAGTSRSRAPDQVTVLCVRGPDDANEYVIDAPGTVAVTVVTADLGSAYLGNWAEFVEWAAARLADADALPEGTNVRSAIEKLVWQTFVRYNHQALAPGVTDTPSLRPLLTPRPRGL